MGLSKEELRQVEDSADKFLLAGPPAASEDSGPTRKDRSKAPLTGDVNINSLLDVVSVLIFFFLKSYSGTTVQVKPAKDLQVPFTSSMADVEQSPAITITQKVILFNDKKVVMLEEGGTVPTTVTSQAGMLIDPLYEKLTEEIATQKRLAALNPTAKPPDICSFIIDRHVKFPVLTQAMYTAGLSGLSKFKLVEIKAESLVNN